MSRVPNKASKQSSQSSISQEQDQYRNRITMMNNNRREYLKEQVGISNQEISSDSSDDDQIYDNFAKSNSNPNFGHTNSGLAKAINIQDENNDSLDDSNLEDEPAQNNRGLHYSDTQESEDESQEQEDFNKYPLGKGINTVREDSQEDSQDESIDHIEQRIKKLQRDLQNRLGKQTNKKQEKNTKAGKVVLSSKVYPPMPNPTKIMNSQIKNQQNQDSQNQNKMFMMNQNQIPYKKEAKKPILSYLNAENKTKKQIQNLNENEVGIKKKKKLQKKQANPESKTQIKDIQNLVKKQKNKKQTKDKDERSAISDKNIQSQKGINNDIQALMVRVSQMQSTIQQLKTENKSLKIQLEQNKQKQQLKNKKKPVFELQKLQELSKSSNNSKLDKQIELLQVIEKLQTKLKKSIHKKLSQNQRGSSSTALLHKGLPASFLANI